MIKESGGGIGLNIEDIAGNILLCADDIVIFAENETDLKLLLNIVEIWCPKWRLGVNLTTENKTRMGNYWKIF